jgi:hypothetical protein
VEGAAASSGSESDRLRERRRSGSKPSVVSMMLRVPFSVTDRSELLLGGCMPCCGSLCWR